MGPHLRVTFAAKGFLLLIILAVVLEKYEVECKNKDDERDEKRRPKRETVGNLS